MYVFLMNMSYFYFSVSNNISAQLVGNYIYKYLTNMQKCMQTTNIISIEHINDHIINLTLIEYHKLGDLIGVFFFFNICTQSNPQRNQINGVKTFDLTILCLFRKLYTLYTERTNLCPNKGPSHVEIPRMFYTGFNPRFLYSRPSTFVHYRLHNKIRGVVLKQMS
jgi:hypothetical protein